jgi:hypothetical protein
MRNRTIIVDRAQLSKIFRIGPRETRAYTQGRKKTKDSKQPTQTLFTGYSIGKNIRSVKFMHMAFINTPNEKGCFQRMETPLLP